MAVVYGIQVIRNVDPRVTESSGMGIMTPLPPDTMRMGTPEMIVRLFFGSDIDPARVLFAIEKSRSVDWDNLRRQMVDPFVFYNFADGSVHGLPRMEEKEYTMAGKKLQSWCVRVFPTVVVREEKITDTYETFRRCSTLYTKTSIFILTYIPTMR